MYQKKTSSYLNKGQKLSKDCQRIKPFRKPHGNMIALGAGVSAILLIVFMTFGLNYVRLCGTSKMQNTAIEAAGIAAAADISRIVYDDPNFGLVALSDNPPIAPPGTNANLAGDNYPVSVESINVIFGTIYLDAQIADAMKSQGSLSPGTYDQLMFLIKEDYQNAIAAAQGLKQVLNEAVSGTPKADWYGNLVNPCQDAQNAYNTNLASINKNGSQQSGIVSLSLGYLNQSSYTNIPMPNQWNNYVNSGSPNYCFLSNNDYKQDNVDFVFSAIGSNIQLVDNTSFSLSPVSSIQTLIPTIIKAQANQSITSKNSDGSNNIVSLKAIACAEPANQLDPRPNPGSMVIRFPDGSIPSLITPCDIITNPLLNLPISTSIPGGAGGKSGPNKPVAGDFQPVPGGGFVGGGSGAKTPLLMPVASSSGLSLNRHFITGLYDWLKQAGLKPVVNAAKAGSSNNSSSSGNLVYQGDVPSILNQPFQSISHSSPQYNLAGYSYTYTAESVPVYNSSTNTTTYTTRYYEMRTPIYSKYYNEANVYAFGSDGRVNVTLETANPYLAPDSLVNQNQHFVWAPSVISQSASLNPTQPHINGPSTNVSAPTTTPVTSTVPSTSSTSSTSSTTSTTSTSSTSTTDRWVALNGTNISTSNWNNYDAFLRDNTRYSGRSKGGQHAGTPNQAISPGSYGQPVYQIPPGYNVRPSYLTNGTAVDLRFCLSQSFSSTLPVFKNPKH